MFFDVRKAADHETSHIPGVAGHNVTKVYTLESGFKVWTEKFPENIES